MGEGSLLLWLRIAVSLVYISAECAEKSDDCRRVSCVRLSENAMQTRDVKKSDGDISRNALFRIYSRYSERVFITDVCRVILRFEEYSYICKKYIDIGE